MDEMKQIINEEQREQAVEPMTDATPAELAQTIADVLDAKRARDVRVINMTEKSDICDFMVLATATSSTHVKALGGEVEYQMDRRQVAPLHIEGRDNNAWVVLDYSHVMVHVFTKETREFYNLDRLYGED